MNKNIYVPVRTKYQRDILADRSPQNPANKILFGDMVSKLIVTSSCEQSTLIMIAGGDTPPLTNDFTKIFYSGRPLQ